ncbi:major facilitator superfamily protein [Klebsiella pneumoniae]|uniref:MFS transporter n=1 Tax=Klebsiella pneumoniae TaxID=573 RepID=UPI001082713E|nr:MFS transporter [Klebsiella pneumoniae]VGB56153.1 major facilitator superfamily protein [Klebsiella pneumoniae]
MMHRISHWLSRHAAALFFPAALILYDFSAYLTTDLIQPGILHVVRDFNADVALAPASVSLYMAGGMALQWLLGPLSDRIGRRPVLLTGAALMHFIHWKALFGIIAAMGLVAWLGLLLTMPETVRRGDVPFSPLGVLRDFRNVFRNRIFLLGAATLSLSYIPLMSWVAVSPVILMDAGGLTTSEFAWSQVPVFSAVIIANLSVARWVKDPTRPRFVLSAVPVQMLGLAILIVGNLVWPHVWLWSVLGTCFYAFGIGLIFPTLFRFTLFSNDLPKGTVSASLNIVILSVSALSIEGARWLWFHGGRLPFHLLAVAAGIVAACCLAGLLRHQRGQAVIEARQS